MACSRLFLRVKAPIFLSVFPYVILEQRLPTSIAASPAFNVSSRVQLGARGQLGRCSIFFGSPRCSDAPSHQTVLRLAHADPKALQGSPHWGSPHGDGPIFLPMRFPLWGE